MITLIVSACLISDPQSCKTFRLPITDQESTFSCIMAAPPLLPQWTDDHPGWQITKWTCGSSQVADM